MVGAIALMAPLVAPALGFDVEQSSEAGYDSAMYFVAPRRQDQHANSVAAWDAQGRQTHTTAGIVPVQPGGFRFDIDLATAWADFQQPAAGVDATARSYARLSGYYLNTNANSFASNKIHLVDTVTVENAGPAAYFNLVQTTHGTLISAGGVQAFASEATTYLGGCFQGCYEVDQTTPVQGIGGTWSGAATVQGGGIYLGGQTFQVLGDWAGSDRTYARSVAEYSTTDLVRGIELRALVNTRSIYLATGAKLLIDVDFQGEYGVRTSAAGDLLSFGEADFSGTGLIDYAAFDAVTGLPAAGVIFQLSPAPVPLPSALWMAGAGFGWLVSFGARRAV